MTAVAGNVKVIFEGQDVSLSQTFENARKKAAEMGSGVGAASATVKRELKEAQGAVAVFGEEVGVHLPRHVQKFLVALPGVSKVVAQAFSAVAIFSMGSAVVELGGKVAKFFEEQAEAARKNAAAWRSLRDPLEQNNDELRVTNDKLDVAIAKLEHKPQSGIKLAIDEAIVSAEKLSTKLTESVSKLHDTLKQAQPGIVARFFGVQGEGDIVGRSKDLEEKMSDMKVSERDKSEAMRGSGASPQAVEEAMRTFDEARVKAFKDEIQWAKQQLQDAVHEQRAQQFGAGQNGYNQGPRIGALKNYIGSLGDMADSVDLTHTQQDKQGVVDHLQAGEAAKHAAAERLAEMERELQTDELLHGKSLTGEISYWRDRVKVFDQGSSEWVAVMERLRAANEKYFDAPMSSRLKASGEQQSQYVMDEQSGGLYGFKASDSGHAEYAAAQEKASSSQAGLNAKIQEEADKLAVARGQMDAHTEASRARVREFQTYLAQDAAIAKQIHELSGNLAFEQITGGVDYETRAKLLGLETQRNDLGGKYAVSDMQSRQTEEMTTAMGRLHEETDKLANQFTDLGGYLSEGLKQSLDEFNNTVVRALSGQKTSWGDMGAGVFRTASKDALQGAEGKIMKAFGFGKKGDGYHVYVDNMAGAQANGAILSSMSGGGGLGNLVRSATSAVGSFALPHFASGGTIGAGTAALVGENGPELFMSASSGRIVPNDAISLGGGGGVNFHTSIDATGSTDPAAVQAAVNRAMASYVPHMTAMARAAIVPQ
ncbi:hypothetical protein ACOBR2_06710 [Telmatobacter bradus]|uniref:hypothetical protein n=1 Tax=Telmatobacter bradus TaxID=474953 RepID=UPI003B432C1B